jgi:ERCC4-type nuclease
VILLDDRGGATAKDSENHYPTRLNAMIPNSTLTRLESGDVAFGGVNGITIGIELKHLSDALSCIYSSRLADTQLPAMAEAYDIRYLIIEDLYRPEPYSGVLQRWCPFKSEKEVKCGMWRDATAGRQRVMFSTFEAWLHTLAEHGGVRLEKTASIETTAALISALYTWWNRSEHRSMNVMANPAMTAELSRPTLLRRMAALLPSVGWERSKNVAAHFTSVYDMVSATEKEWTEIDGIGRGIASKVVKALNGYAHGDRT